MAVMMQMVWEGVSLEQYQQCREKVDWEGNRPEGARHHVCGHDGKALRVVDVWDQPEQFQAFVENRLMPVVAELGITSQPVVEMLPAYAVYAPFEK